VNLDNDPLVNVPAEAVVLGGMLLENRLILDFADRLRPDDFAEPLHQRIFSAMLRFSAKGAPATAVTLRPVFVMDRDADGGNYLDALIDSPAAVVGVPEHTEQVVELSVRRKAREAMLSGADRIQDLEIAVGDVVGGVEEQVWKAQRDEQDHPLLDMGELVGLVRARQARINAGEETVGATNTLIPDMETLLGPLERGTYTLIAGRPGMGKTTVAASASIGWALAGFAGLRLGTEMSEEQDAMRTVSDLSYAMGQGIDHDRIRRGKLDDADLRWLERVEARAALLPLRYQKIGACNWRRVYSIVAREKARLKALGKDLWFVVVDYLGMLEAEDANGRTIDDPRKRMNEVSAGMMRIRDELNVAVVALAQLSREVEKRVDKRPQVSDLRDTGNLEQDADAVLLAYREEYYLELDKPKAGDQDSKSGKTKLEEWEVEMNLVRGKMDLIVGKNRHGQRFTKTIKFVARHYAARGSGFNEYVEIDDMFGG
jgi:replicative DNA helicase